MTLRLISKSIAFGCLTAAFQGAYSGEYIDTDFNTRIFDGFDTVCDQTGTLSEYRPTETTWDCQIYSNPTQHICNFQTTPGGWDEVEIETCRNGDANYYNMHTCQYGAMVGIHVGRNELACETMFLDGHRAANAHFEGASSGSNIDTDTLRSGMHACPTGRIMHGIHENKNELLCLRPDKDIYPELEFIDYSTKRYGMHTCPIGSVMTGIHVGNDRLLCTPFDNTQELLPSTKVTFEGSVGALSSVEIRLNGNKVCEDTNLSWSFSHASCTTNITDEGEVTFYVYGGNEAVWVGGCSNGHDGESNCVVNLDGNDITLQYEVDPAEYED